MSNTRPSGSKLSQARPPRSGTRLPENRQPRTVRRIDDPRLFIALQRPAESRKDSTAGVLRGHGCQARHRRAEGSTARSATRADNALDRGLAASRPLSTHDGPFEAGRACMRAFQLNWNDTVERARSLRALNDIDGEQHGGANHG